MVMIDAVVVPVAIPIVAAIQAPSWTRKTWVDIPIRSIRKPVASVISDVVADVHVVANIDVCVVPDARSIAADTRSVHNVVDIVDVVA
jgi:hypothetical protein